MICFLYLFDCQTDQINMYRPISEDEFRKKNARLPDELNCRKWIMSYRRFAHRIVFLWQYT